MLVKAGMDHGPFSGRQVVNMIVQGDALRDHELMNTDTGNRGKDRRSFLSFMTSLPQYELRRGEEERAVALQKSETSEKHGPPFFKVGIGIAAVVLILGAAAGYLRADALRTLSVTTRKARPRLAICTNVVHSKSPDRPASCRCAVAAGAARRTGAGGGGGGGGPNSSYEDAMMQAVDIGSAAGGGEQTAQCADRGWRDEPSRSTRSSNSLREGRGWVRSRSTSPSPSSGQVVGVSVNARAMPRHTELRRRPGEAGALPVVLSASHGCALQFLHARSAVHSSLVLGSLSDSGRQPAQTPTTALRADLRRSPGPCGRGAACGEQT